MTSLQNHADLRSSDAGAADGPGRHRGGLDARIAAAGGWEVRRRQLRARAARYEVVDDDRRLDHLARATTRLAGSVLELFGWHRHARGAWRKRKGPIAVERDPTPSEAQRVAGDLDLRLTVRRAVGPVDRGSVGFLGRDYLEQLRARARANLDALIASARSDRPAAGRLLAQVDKSGYGREVALAYRLEPLDERIEAAILARLEPRDLLRRETIARRMDQVRAALAGPKGPSPVERLIVDRAVTCWLAVQECELGILGPEAGPVDEEAERRLGRANRRLMDVLRALDHVRRKVPAHHLARVKLVGEAPPPAIDVTPEPDPELEATDS